MSSIELKKKLFLLLPFALDYFDLVSCPYRQTLFLYIQFFFFFPFLVHFSRPWSRVAIFVPPPFRVEPSCGWRWLRGKKKVDFAALNILLFKQYTIFFF